MYHYCISALIRIEREMHNRPDMHKEDLLLYSSYSQGDSTLLDDHFGPHSHELSKAAKQDTSVRSNL